jgi:hypothetical protein
LAPDLQATLRLGAGVRAHRQAADRVLEQLRRELGLPLVTLPRVPTAEIGPTLLDELCPALAAAATASATAPAATAPAATTI